MQVHHKLSHRILLGFLDSLLEPIYYTVRVERGTVSAKNLAIEHNTATPGGSIPDLFEKKIDKYAFFS